MYVLNITSKVDHAIIKEWTVWQKEIYLPELVARHCFSNFHFFKLMDHDDNEGEIFISQLEFSSLEEYQLFLKEYDENWRKKVTDKWGEAVLSFRTVLKRM